MSPQQAPELRMDAKGDISIVRPEEPAGAEHVFYRGWEVGFNADAHYWGAEGWQAYRGGVDLDAPMVCSASFKGCLDEIDAQEDE